MGLSDEYPLMLLAASVGLILIGLALGAFALNRHAELVALRASDRSFQDLYDNITEGVFRTSLDGHMLSANPALVRLNGYATEAEMLDEVNDIARRWYVDPNRRAEIHEMLVRHGEVHNVISEVYRYKTRERIWIEENTRLVGGPNGRPRYYEGTVREVTDTVRRLQDQARYEKIARMVPGFLYQHRRTPEGVTSVPYVSAGITALTGLSPEAVTANANLLTELVHPEDRLALLASFDDSIRSMAVRQVEYRIVLPDGTTKWVFGQSAPEREADGSIVWHGYLTDVTAMKRAEKRIFELAYGDSLTGLPNRTALGERLQRVLEETSEHVEWGGLLFIDLDQFKVLNDTKGHHFGDQLLRGVAARLRAVVGSATMIARLGGDEFVVVLSRLGSNPDDAQLHARRVAERIHVSIADPFLLDGFPFHTTASIGAALFRGGEIGVDEILKRADMAMYEAKAAGRGSVAFFKIEMQDTLEERLALTGELRRALEEGGLTLAYQPQVDDTGTCFAVEALLRWDHPTRGAISPGVFVPLGERAGLGPQIDAFVLATACRTLRRWQDIPAMRNIGMAVNISGQQFGKRLVALVTSSLNATGIDPTLLTIELTEHVMLDKLDEIDDALAALKGLGVRIALDDFGTGYSSLSHLKRLPIDALKIDCSFVDDIETDANDRVIVQTILNIARNLGVDAIAEGVENEMQALLLRRFGCRAFQGFMYGRPMPAEELERQLGKKEAPAAIHEPPRLVV